MESCNKCRQHIKKQRYHFANKVHVVKAMVFLVVKYGYERWTIKKAECRRIDAFELWCWRRLLRGPWTARRSNLSIIKKINTGRTDAEVEVSIFWPPNAKSRLIGKDPGAGKVFVTQSCPILGDPMDCSPPGSSVHGIFQARIPEWVAIHFSRGSSGLRNRTHLLHCRQIFLPSEPLDWGQKEKWVAEDEMVR